MTDALVSINLLDANQQKVEGVFILNASDHADAQVDIGAELDFAEPEDAALLPPLTDAEERAASDAFARVCIEAMRVETNAPVTPEHEVRVAKALVDLVSMALEDGELAMKLPLARFIQMNPCPAVGVDRALEVLEGLVDPATFRSVRTAFQIRNARAQATHGTPSSRPM